VIEGYQLPVTSTSDREALLRQIAEGVRDERVLAAIAAVPRDRFVPEKQRADAWENRPLPIGEGQTISQPLIVAYMCELLRLRGDETVLDVGTGSGYHAAVLARLAGHVFSIERLESLTARAGEALEAAGVDNVTLVVGDGADGYPPAAPYDAINVAAASDEIPPALQHQLAENGRLVIPTDGASQRLVLLRRRQGHLEREDLEHVRFVPLVSERPATERPRPDPGADPSP
jgi:protein-L-isoaspartate(D-aspartate) O-methyltransferase